MAWKKRISNHANEIVITAADVVYMFEKLLKFFFCLIKPPIKKRLKSSILYPVNELDF